MVRKWDWFIPIMPPSKALIAEMTKIKDVAVLFKINDRIIRGANFCQEARIEQEIHDSEVITEGNQKWKGAIPNLSIIADINKRFIDCIDEVDHWANLDISIMLDPNAWAIKYLMAASVSWLVFELVIIGINLNILISIDIHRNIQLDLDSAIIDLIIKVDEVINMNGLFM